MLNLLCKVGEHHGAWFYDSDGKEVTTSDEAGWPSPMPNSWSDPNVRDDPSRAPGDASRSVTCAQTRICRRCGVQSRRVEHDVLDWEGPSHKWSILWWGSVESGMCIRCQHMQYRRGYWDWDSY